MTTMASSISTDNQDTLATLFISHSPQHSDRALPMKLCNGYA